MGRATDRSRIQFRMLNRSKGPAVRSPRAQCDRGLYRRAVRGLLERQPRLAVVQGTAGSLLVDGGRVRGLVTLDGRHYAAPAVVLTAGHLSQGFDPSRPRYPGTGWPGRRRTHCRNIASACGSWTYSESLQDRDSTENRRTDGGSVAIGSAGWGCRSVLVLIL